MCIILLAYQRSREYRLILAANRDEYYRRPTQPLSFWDDCPHVLAGRDLTSKGTWLGVSDKGKLAALTNFKESGPRKANPPSRGLLVSNFLKHDRSPHRYLSEVRDVGDRYNGFNLIAMDDSGLFYYSNRKKALQRLDPGIYGLSNHLLDSPWPKVVKAKSRFAALLATRRQIIPDDLFDILGDQTCFPVTKTRSADEDAERESALSAVFIKTDDYGTRSSSVILAGNHGDVRFVERTFISDNKRPDHYTLKDVELMSSKQASGFAPVP